MQRERPHANEYTAVMALSILDGNLPEDRA